MFRTLNDEPGTAYALENLGMALYQQGELEPATQFLEEGLELFRDFEDKMGILLALDDLGVIACAQGRFQSTAEYCTAKVCGWLGRQKKDAASHFVWRDWLWSPD